MRRCAISWSVPLLVLWSSVVPAWAQPAGDVPRVGFVSASSAAAIADRTAAFRAGLKELGYVEGRNIIVEYRWADGRFDRLPGLLTSLVRANVQVIVSAGPSVTRQAKRSRLTLPIVMAFDIDPVGEGVVSSLARPGGNITGLVSLAPQTSRKQIELLREVLPELSRLAIVGDSAIPGHFETLGELLATCRRLNITVQQLDIRSFADLETLFQSAKNEGAQAMLILTSPIATERRAKIVALAAKAKLPALYSHPEFADAGGLMNYGASIPDLFRRAAAYVDRILKGTPPASLPIEQPTQFEFVINAKTARDLGLRIPPSVLTRADRIIR
jgi:putative ABC transport system substrate-binding protein